MARVWLINCRGIAKKVKNATSYSNYQLRDFGDEANRECPNCQHIIDNSDVSSELPGLPAGVKFDPTDLEILEHLSAKAGVGIAKAHIFIDEFIPTIDGEEGICYTHPQNLPGMRKDGSTLHFFHRSLNAYATGNKKRRKIPCECGETEERLRWHKTGKTKPVVENGAVKGWKKIMVLYKSVGKGNKPDKANWVMHQYHLGMEEEEKDGEFVVSKIFYQQTKHMDCNEIEKVEDLSNVLTVNLQEKQAPEVELPPSTHPIVNLKDEEPNSQLKNESLLCRAVLDHLSPLKETPLQLNYLDMLRGYKDQLETVADSAYGFPSLEDMEVDTPPDFQLSDLQFGSQDSITSWLDQL